MSKQFLPNDGARPQTQSPAFLAAAIVVSREGARLVPIQAVDFYPVRPAVETKRAEVVNAAA